MAASVTTDFLSFYKVVLASFIPSHLPIILNADTPPSDKGIWFDLPPFQPMAPPLYKNNTVTKSLERDYPFLNMHHF